MKDAQKLVPSPPAETDWAKKRGIIPSTFSESKQTERRGDCTEGSLAEEWG